jgi:polyhydroxyalkanoate synthesis regulator phasin
MAAAAEQSILQSIVEARADVREVKEQLQGATGDKEVALQQRLAALEQQLAALEQQLAALRQKEVLLMQQQAGAAWSQCC